MTKKLYTYKKYGTDGIITELPPCPKKDFQGAGGLYEIVGCTMLELVPKDYYPDGLSRRVTAFCDEEGLFKAVTHLNPFFTNIVGNVVTEEVYHDL